MNKSYTNWEYTNGYISALNKALETITHIERDLNRYKISYNPKTYIDILRCMKRDSDKLIKYRYSFVYYDAYIDGKFKVYPHK